jgi:predicted nucleic acid-binding protein
MTDRRAVVLDASVGVKWFFDEPGSAQARELYLRASEGEIDLVAPAHFVHEVLAVVRRAMGVSAVFEAWGCLKDTSITFVPLTDEVVEAAAVQCERLGCSFYDALAPACASLFGATLASADARAHARYPGVRLLHEQDRA